MAYNMTLLVSMRLIYGTENTLFMPVIDRGLQSQHSSFSSRNDTIMFGGIVALEKQLIKVLFVVQARNDHADL